MTNPAAFRLSQQPVRKYRRETTVRQRSVPVTITSSPEKFKRLDPKNQKSNQKKFDIDCFQD